MQSVYVTKEIRSPELPYLRKIVGIPVRMHRIHDRVERIQRIDVEIIIYVRMLSLLESSVSDKERLSRTCDQTLRLPLTRIIGIVLR